MTSRILVVAVVVAVSAGFVGYGFGAGEAGPHTAPDMVKTYSELATVLLGSKKTESALVKGICADAHNQAQMYLHGALEEAKAGRKDVAADHLEKAASAAAMIATEGDKAVAAVRERLLEGGHHHHASAEVAKQYDAGYVVVKKAAKKLLLAEAQGIGKLAGMVRSGSAGAGEIEAAAKHLATVFQASIP